MLIPTTPPRAAAWISGGRKYSAVRGNVTFYPMWGGVLVVAQIRGLPESGNGIFAMHIHDGNSCTGRDFADAGGHYDPQSRPHPEHAGDLLPLFRCCGGRTYLAMVTSRFSIEEVIGKTVIIHSGADDFRSQPAGNSGDRIACGVIRRV